MAYTTNEKLPEIRAQAVRLVREGWSTRKAARHFGYTQSAVVKWCKRAPKTYDPKRIETRSSAPHTSPASLPKETVGRIIHARLKSRRCAEVVHEMLKAEGVKVSLSSIKRKLNIYGLLKKRSPWKKRRMYPPRPEAKSPGMLVQIDTIHFATKDGRRIYVYTALDVYSRYGFAILAKRISAKHSTSFLKKAITYFPFKIKNIQTDNGSEFSFFFTDFVVRYGMTHRHIHPRSPNENGHLERFNRTIQEEIGRFGWCIFTRKDIRSFLKYYNTERMHMGIDFKTPSQLITK
ncbi:MAG: DDE-type integrase/transposase/recombinase [Candidatus Pacebacteria bacterium]|nr:DDE-type integrase/transposase/recombinase [Candidatus Paceibacterota bacterium]